MLSFLSWPGDGNSYTVNVLQQPHGVSGSGEDPKGAGSHSHDGSHQYECCADNYCSVQPGGGFFFYYLFFFFLTQSLSTASTILVYWMCSLSPDITQGVPHRPVSGKDAPHPGCNPWKVCPVAVQPPLQDPPPVAHVPFCCYGARCPQLAVPQHYSGTGPGHQWHAGTLNSFNPHLSWASILKNPLCPLWRSGSRGIYRFTVAVTGWWTL